MPVTRRNRKSEEESSPSPEIDLTKIKDLIKLMEDHDLTAFELCLLYTSDAADE